MQRGASDEPAVAMGAQTEPALFITIPLSHYCEKARWALDRVALPYVESAHVPLLHRLATRRHSGSSVPVLVHRQQRFISSTEILRHAEVFCGGDFLYSRDAAINREIDGWVLRFDQGLGPPARQWAYGHLLSERPILLDIWSRGVSRFEARLLPVIVPIARRLIRKGYRVTGEGAQRALGRIATLFKEIADTLSDGRRFLAGDRFTAADLCFAALASPLILPKGCGAAYPSLEVVPVAMREQILRFRDTAPGRYAERLYLEERSRPA